MIQTSRTLVTTVAATAVLTLASVLGLCHLLQEQSECARAAADLDDCQRLESEIRSLRKLPAVVRPSEGQTGQTATQIEKAASAVGLKPLENMLSVAPEAPRRIGDTAYKEVPTTVLLKGVLLRQAIGLICALEDQSLECRTLRLSAPKQDSGDQWTVEMTVSYLFYAPPPGSARGE